MGHKQTQSDHASKQELCANHWSKISYNIAPGIFITSDNSEYHYICFLQSLYLFFLRWNYCPLYKQTEIDFFPRVKHDKNPFFLFKKVIAFLRKDQTLLEHPNRNKRLKTNKQLNTISNSLYSTSKQTSKKSSGKKKKSGKLNVTGYVNKR